MHAAPTQKGAILPFVAVALIALLATGALALDVGHAYLNKTRLQNALDASALAGAKVLDVTKSEAQARAAALDNFSANAGETGNAELAAALGGGLGVSVEFSNTLNPFVVGSTPAQYVRVRARGFGFAAWLATVVGIAELEVGGSAVAGPTPTLEETCNIAPMMICGTNDPPWYGYEPGVTQTLKTSSSSGSFEVGPGNFQLIRLDDSQGGSDIRSAMAGNYENCLASDDVIDTEPGNTVGPVVQGLNTRFGIYQGPFSDADRATYRPDLVSEHHGDLSFRFADYVNDYMNGIFDQPDGEAERRILPVPVGDCSATVSGQGQVPMLGFACFFLLEPVKQQGTQSEVYGEFIDGCNAQGVPGSAPNSGPGPYKIVLHKDPDSGDS